MNLETSKTITRELYRISENYLILYVSDARTTWHKDYKKTKIIEEKIVISEQEKNIKPLREIGVKIEEGEEKPFDKAHAPLKEDLVSKIKSSLYIPKKIKKFLEQGKIL